MEAKYGLRPPRHLAPGETRRPDPLIDAETVREIESYYAEKRLRDQARAGKVSPHGRPAALNRQTLAERGAIGVD